MRPGEYPLLEDFLYDAIYLPKGSTPPPREIIRRPELAVYVEHFGQPDDRCLVAEDGGCFFGAVWTRILAGNVKGYGNLDSRTPEVAISVKKEFRRQGIGRKLMEEMLVLLKKDGYESVSLSVNKENYAYQMYRKLGFQTVKEQDEDFLTRLDLRQGEEKKQIVLFAEE
ncbi:MAG: N-acetyltransferase [Eubacteriales bacterium]|nr:N-acetyltransferase [Eubacteriales bacterium]